MMTRLFCLSLFLVLLTSCSTNKFIHQPAKNFSSISCAIQEECEILYGAGGEEGTLNYTVQALDDGTFRVKGYVDMDIEMYTVGGKRPQIIFYVLFMNGDTVIAERKVRTATKSADFEFDIEINSESDPEKTAIAGTVFKYWS